MSLEAIAAMFGHRSMDTTLRYAKIASRTVADEYFAVTDQIDALYATAEPLPADSIGPARPHRVPPHAASPSTTTPQPKAKGHRAALFDQLV